MELILLHIKRHIKSVGGGGMSERKATESGGQLSEYCLCHTVCLSVRNSSYRHPFDPKISLQGFSATSISITFRHSLRRFPLAPHLSLISSRHQCSGATTISPHRNNRTDRDPLVLYYCRLIVPGVEPR